MKMEDMLAVMRADNDQDLENLAEWMRDTDNGELIKLWLMMNEPYPNPYTEAMTRFAILGFALVADKVFAKPDDLEATDA